MARVRLGDRLTCTCSVPDLFTPRATRNVAALPAATFAGGAGPTLPGSCTGSASGAGGASSTCMSTRSMAVPLPFVMVTVTTKGVKVFTSRTHPLGQQGAGLVTVTVTPSGQRWVVPKRDGVVVAALEDRREAAVVAGLVDELLGADATAVRRSPNPRLTIQRLRSFTGGR